MFSVKLKADDWVPWIKQRRRFRERTENVKNMWTVKLALISKLRAECQVWNHALSVLRCLVSIWGSTQGAPDVGCLVLPILKGSSRTLWAGQAALIILCYPSLWPFWGKCAVWVARKSCPYFTLGFHFLKMARGARHSVCSFSSVLG